MAFVYQHQRRVAHGAEWLYAAHRRAGAVVRRASSTSVSRGLPHRRVPARRSNGGGDLNLLEPDADFEAASQEYQAAHRAWEQAERRLLQAREKLFAARSRMNRAFLEDVNGREN